MRSAWRDTRLSKLCLALSCSTACTLDSSRSTAVTLAPSMCNTATCLPRPAPLSNTDLPMNSSGVICKYLKKFCCRSSAYDSAPCRAASQSLLSRRKLLRVGDLGSRKEVNHLSVAFQHLSHDRCDPLGA